MAEAVVDSSIFKAYDVRGTYPDQLDGEVAYRIGRAFVRVLAAEYGAPAAGLQVGLGRDMRLSAPEMAGRYADGMRDEGASVHDVGQVGTEQLYFAVGARGWDGGLMCTASHNPAAYTGAKLVKREAIPLSGDTGIVGDRPARGGGSRAGGGRGRRARRGGRGRRVPGSRRCVRRRGLRAGR